MRVFRGYAGWMRTADFGDAVTAVLAESADVPTVVMCSESLWWRCHRRLVADFATVARDVPVVHLLHSGKSEAHTPTDGVRRRDDGLLVYDAGQPPLGEEDGHGANRSTGGAAGRLDSATGGEGSPGEDVGEQGGDAACWLDRVCPDCGAFVEGPTCWRCGRAPATS